MMKKIAFALALLLPMAAAAQTDFEGVRLSVGADWKITKGLHLNVEEEARIGGAFQSLNRLQTTVGMEYKPLSFLKVGVGVSDTVKRRMTLTDPTVKSME